MGVVISGDRELTSEALLDRAARAANGLASLGVGAGDVVAVCLRNDFPFFEASYAAGFLGAYPTPVNWHYTAEEARYLLEDSGARALVIHTDLLEAIRLGVPQGVAILAVETPKEIARAYNIAPVSRKPADRTMLWNHWLESFEPQRERAIAPGSIIYTSGTTGRPKGVRRLAPTASQSGLISRIIMRGFGFDVECGEDIVTVITGPMYHFAPNTYALVAARLGAKVILQPRFEPEELLQIIESQRVTHLHMVPIMFNRLLKLSAELREKYDVSSLRFVVHAAAPCPAPIKRAMIDWWGPIIHEYYGATETGLVASCTPDDWLAHPGTVGKPIPEAEVRVVDDRGREAAPHVVGEIVAKIHDAADFTYHGDEEERRMTEKAGLIAPGDVGYFDDDGFLYLCDRAKDMIISGGVNIYPAEIEAELHKISGVADCAVFGIPDEEFGESVCAVIQPHPSSALSESGIKSSLRTVLAGYKVPRRVDFVSELPREDSGKIFKRRLREAYWEGLGRRI